MSERLDTSLAEPLGVYVHWPFCLSICPYCDFNVHVFKNVDQDSWLKAYAAEIQHLGHLTDYAHPVTSVFFGGGTPSLVRPDILEGVLNEITSVWGLSPNAEITLEANPVGLDRPLLVDLKTAGITRFSMGVQSLDDAALSFLGRTHNAADAIAAFALARDVFDYASLDMIYARPDQTVDAWTAELTTALALAPDHLSAYQLTIEQGTNFGKLYQAGRLTLPEEDVQIGLYDVTQSLCHDAGLAAYEVSNHARSGHESRHNIQCWQGSPYIGIGPGAHGRVDVEGQRHASIGIKQPAAWLASASNLSVGHGLASLERLSKEEVFEERMMFGLRLVEGVSLSNITENAELPVGALDLVKINFLVSAGLLEDRQDRLVATRSGRLVLDRLVAELLLA
ncbi:MAG: hypothetical protein CBE09_01295 [Rhizobiales bacterium TMED249]|uniref:Heme chaperone HemW n=1 Tax=PS1 clade bacterium TaxID=2175152 RepID=A0A368E4N1_9PROT|nr:MAG: hypothetical protein CBE09_01295 [Rhizobiales bacterium TMED249]RCL78421.1 MAG: coproporphyrinogen III oxidase [PS1 clade bacterium]HAK98793.1 coproporphyrinogen III oxidase [Rhodobiaceae bacterium]HCV49540.1 coproporphyrinogen III oxidase [Rhodobiaceae bacterium]